MGASVLGTLERLGTPSIASASASSSWADTSTSEISGGTDPGFEDGDGAA